MLKNITFGMFCCCALWLFAGCAAPASFAEAMQLREGEKVYTACNIWYENPKSIDCRNIQRGSFIPVGSEIVPVKTVWNGDIVFQDKAGKEYTIKFSEDYRLCPMSDFINYTFTVKSREEQLKGLSPAVKSRILRGEVVPGMNEKQVKLAYGLPPAIRTPDLRNDSWIYYISSTDTVRVMFRGGIVRNVLNLNERR